jgi:hypothetical protein
MSHATLLSSLLALVVLTLPAVAGAQTTWHVDANYAGCPGSGTADDPFCTIGAAIVAAAPGDTIEVAAGRYTEYVTVTKDGLTLRGAGAGVTQIVGTPGVATVAPIGFPDIPDFTLKGFHISSEDPNAIQYQMGVVANPANEPGALWTVRGCVIEGYMTGIFATDAWDGGQIVIEDTVVTNGATGIMVVGDAIAIRRCTIQHMEGIGIWAPGPTDFSVADTIITSTDAWAIQRYWGSGIGVPIERVLVYENNVDNPSSCVSCGPFVMYLAEGFPGGFGVYSNFTPMPGPVLFEDPLFVDPEASDVRLTAGSPAIDVGDPAAVPAAGDYDALGFGHPRVDDGDFDGAARLDLGAIEFGGLLDNAGLDGALGVGDAFVLDQSGKPGAVYAVFAGLAGAPLDLGSKGTLFLQPAPLFGLTTGVLPAGGTQTVLAGSLPLAAAGLAVGLQAVQKGPAPGDGLHWTNLERLTILP